MTPFGHAATPFDHRVEAAIARCPGWATDGTRYALAVPPVASPVHRAVASDCVRVERSGAAPAFLKVRHDDMAADVLPWAADAARKAAALGVGPAVVVEAEGLLGLAFLEAPWRDARVGDLQDPAIVGRVLDAKRRLHADSPLGHRFCPFARVDALAQEALAQEAATAGAHLPEDTGQLVAAVALIRTAIVAAGFDLAFCHNDGTASNVMLGEEHGGAAVRLVDFDQAGDNDPWFDVAAVMGEACDFDADRRALVERYAGRYEERLFNRCRLYTAVDDMIWGLWGLTRATTSTRAGIEFFKYGQWRLLHARTTLGAWDFETWLRRL